uniref:Utrophin n=1 Tax=Marmota marmota marmota TaxID=9994 RepID=A0A8C5YMQ6_MARMA
MSRPTATALNWKKCRFDFPGQAALQTCKRIPDEHNDVQKKTFTKWINARFSKVSETCTNILVFQMPHS